MRLFLIGLLFSAGLANAKVEVAFLVLKDANGHVIQFEEGGRFGHVAVAYKGQWLHAHPVRGVELAADLSDIGWDMVVLESTQYDEPSDEYVSQNLGRPFSYKKPWEDLQYTYCAKLLAEPFGISPQPMSFGSQRWKNMADLPKGEMGLSADDLYVYFLNHGFQVKYTIQGLPSTPVQTRMSGMK